MTVLPVPAHSRSGAPHEVQNFLEPADSLALIRIKAGVQQQSKYFRPIR